jgi:hypothetical protein
MNEDKLCKAKTSDGSSCNNKAKYPKDDPIACHLKSHQRQLEVVVDNEEEEIMPEEEKVETKEVVDEPKLHVFASTSLHHVVFVDYDEQPEDGERNYFRAEFDGGKYETYDDKKAELLEKKIKQIKALSRKITKVQ